MEAGANVKLAKIESSLDLITGQQAAHLFTISTLEEFIKYVQVSPKTIETYTRSLRLFLLWLNENDITQPQRFNILIYKKNLEIRCAPATVQVYLSAIRVFFQWLEDAGLYKNVATRIKGARINRGIHRRGYLSEDQARGLLQSINITKVGGKRDFAILALMLTGGLRTVEIVRADIEDIRQEGGEWVLFVQGKARPDKAEYIKLAEKTRAAIRDYLALRGDAEGSGPLFTSGSNNNRGGRLTTKAVSSIVKAALRKNGINDSRISAHSLRHTAGTTAFRQGLSLDEVRQFMRHRDSATTAIYVHDIEKMNNRSAQVLAGAFF